MSSILLRGALFGAEWVMYLLVGLSVWSLAVILERWMFFRRHRADIARLQRDIEHGFDAGDVASVAKKMAQDQSVEAAVVRAALDEVPRGAPAVAEMLAAAQTRERPRTERGLVLLGTLGNNAPFVGLFGTVLGIIGAFHDLAGNPQGGAASVMAGISEALVATAVGLLVALPAVVAFNVFGKCAGDVAQNADLLGHVVLARCKALEAPPLSRAVSAQS